MLQRRSKYGVSGGREEVHCVHSGGKGRRDRVNSACEMPGTIKEVGLTSSSFWCGGAEAAPQGFVLGMVAPGGGYAGGCRKLGGI